MGRKKLLFPHLNHEKNLSSLFLYSSTLRSNSFAATYIEIWPSLLSLYIAFALSSAFFSSIKSSIALHTLSSSPSISTFISSETSFRVTSSRFENLSSLLIYLVSVVFCIQINTRIMRMRKLLFSLLNYRSIYLPSWCTPLR